MKNKYTFLLELRRGVYITHIESKTVLGSLKKFIGLIKSELICREGENIANEIFNNYIRPSKNRDYPLCHDMERPSWYVIVSVTDALGALNTVDLTIFCKTQKNFRKNK